MCDTADTSVMETAVDISINFTSAAKEELELINDIVFDRCSEQIYNLFLKLEKYAFVLFRAFDRAEYNIQQRVAIKGNKLEAYWNVIDIHSTLHVVQIKIDSHATIPVPFKSAYRIKNSFEGMERFMDQTITTMGRQDLTNVKKFMRRLVNSNKDPSRLARWVPVEGNFVLYMADKDQVPNRPVIYVIVNDS